MIQVRTQTLAVDHGLSIFQTVQVGSRNPIIAAVSLLRSDALSTVFDDAGSFADRSVGVDADGVDGGWADD
jgi:hypothetical protein